MPSSMPVQYIVMLCMVALLVVIIVVSTVLLAQQWAWTPTPPSAKAAPLGRQQRKAHIKTEPHTVSADEPCGVCTGEVQTPLPPASAGLKPVGRTSSGIPKRFWAYWDDSNGAAPPVVSACMDSWKRHHPDFDVVLVTPATARQLCGAGATPAPWIDSTTRMSDVVRLLLLQRHGGVWIDASTFLSGPLPPAFQTAMDRHTFVGFYLDGYTTNPRSPVIENWLFATVPHGAFVSAWQSVFLNTAAFGSVDAHLKHVQEVLRVDVQKINGTNYLFMHVAAQVVLQQMQPPGAPTPAAFLPGNGAGIAVLGPAAAPVPFAPIVLPEWDMVLFAAEKGPYRFLVDVEWRNEAAIQGLVELLQARTKRGWLTDDDQTNTIHKMRSCERPYITSSVLDAFRAYTAATFRQD